MSIDTSRKRLKLTTTHQTLHHFLSSENLPLIDLREENEFNTRRISFHKENDNNNRRRTVVNLPFQSLISGSRCCELPPRKTKFAVLVPMTNEISDYDSIKDFFGTHVSTSTNQSRVPWNVECYLIENEELWKELERLYLISSNNNNNNNGNHQQNNNNENTSSSSSSLQNDKNIDLTIMKNTTSMMNNHDHQLKQQQQHHYYYRFEPLPRLWEPDTLVIETLLPLLKKQIVVNHYQLKNKERRRKREKKKKKLHIIDLGSGAGRDVAFLAEECLAYYDYYLLRDKKKNKYDDVFDDSDDDADTMPSSSPSQSRRICFIGIDNHKGSATRCIPFWCRRGLSDVTMSENLNLKNIQKFCELMKSKQLMVLNDDEKSGGEGTTENVVAMIYAVRYLNRQFIRYLTGHPFNKVNNKFEQQNRESFVIDAASFIRKGTIFAISHFCKAAKGAKWEFDHPNEKQILERNELFDLFSSSTMGWKVIKDEICIDSDFGRTMLHFVAVKS